jgi:predicted RNA binding protein YcfA (HicA-like mRNA interferase family)
MTLLRNRGSDEVKRTLIRLLGKPVGIEGSHHLFRCRDGRRYPISLHPQEPVGIGLLKKCLQHFRIDPEEFYEELG